MKMIVPMTNSRFLESVFFFVYPSRQRIIQTAVSTRFLKYVCSDIYTLCSADSCHANTDRILRLTTTFMLTVLSVSCSSFSVKKKEKENKSFNCVPQNRSQPSSRGCHSFHSFSVSYPPIFPSLEVSSTAASQSDCECLRTHADSLGTVHKFSTQGRVWGRGKPSSAHVCILERLNIVLYPWSVSLTSSIALLLWLIQVQWS